jgi:nucleotide-binding universal stress UspA family protein
MSYAAILVYVDAEYPSRSHIELAADLADRFNSNFIGVSALLTEAPVLAGGVAASAVRATGGEQQLSSAGDLFRAVGSRQKLKVEWRSFVDPPLGVLAREARAADLIVIQSNPKHGVNRSSPDAGDVVMELGRPVLLVPQGVAALRARHVVIGWKDAREARRAVSDALPFLHDAETVTVVEVCDTSEKALAQSRLDDVVHFLAHHRIKARSQIVHPAKASGAGQLLQVAQDATADLVVTGAYGGSRIGEWILGGMTRDLIKHSPICCLMSH